jgi:hypothetical protein
MFRSVCVRVDSVHGKTNRAKCFHETACVFQARTISSRMVSSRMLRRVALVRTDVSEELSASFIMVTRISELGTTLAVTSNRRISSRRASVASYS